MPPKDNLLSLDMGTDDCLYRLHRDLDSTSTVIYVHLQTLSLLPTESLTYGPDLVKNLRLNVPSWDEPWMTLTITTQQRLQWACDAAEGLQVLHENGVWHCDLRTVNFLLDETLRLKIIDFEGSSPDGCEPSSLENTRFFLPRDWREPSTARTELFALGSVIYEIMTGKEPYLELGDEEVTALFEEKKFPPVDQLPCGDIIMKCWLGELHSAEEVRALIEGKLHDYEAKV
ncbi:hypothetical protein VE03_09240 [Pseudogymnoascus sp. 23342-1-I1]|nr:hypothetical protein VE03_09240 [Pseudogymnoascus sp. 23342-1-I1]